MRQPYLRNRIVLDLVAKRRKTPQHGWKPWFAPADWYTRRLVQKDAATVQAMFGDIAPRYDLLNHLLSLNVDRRWRRRTATLAAPRGPVLDVCTGTGDLAAALAEAAGRPVVGVDFCAPMLVRGRDKKECRQVRFCRGDALKLPLPTDTFDVVSVGFGIRNVSDLDRGLKELVRVARPGGRVAILEFIPPKSRFVRFYLDRVVPFLGNAISRSRAYSYLNRSVLEWANEAELAQRLRAAGCPSVTVHPLTFGFAAVHLGVKRGEEAQD
jgi:demethylmenaquinone methyltransferase/2-methoxy-6-polyprenyl-1,4-benzoquinol methylase